MSTSRWQRIRGDGSLESRPAELSPAPWRVYVDPKGGRNAITVHAGDCTIVCVVDSDEPDAYAIGALPELLHACEQLVAIETTAGGLRPGAICSYCNGPADHAKEPNCPVQLARLAITKARNR